MAIDFGSTEKLIWTGIDPETLENRFILEFVSNIDDKWMDIGVEKWASIDLITTKYENTSFLWAF